MRKLIFIILLFVADGCNSQNSEKMKHIYTNNLIIRNGKITGDFEWPVGADRKQTILRQLCDENNVFYKDCIVVVHEDNDIKMAKTAGFAIGFNPKGEVKKYCKVIVKDLININSRLTAT